MGERIPLLCLIILVLFGCTKKQTVQVRYFHIPEALKKVAIFQKDTYWVYRNDSTGEVDCTYVSAIPVSGTRMNGDQNEYITDYIQIPVHSNLFTQFYLSGMLGDFPQYSGYPFFVLAKGFFMGCSPGETAYVLYDDSLINHNGGNWYNCNTDPKIPEIHGDEFIETGEYSNFVVNDVVFDKVRETRSIFSGFGDKLDDTIDFFFSPGNGLVKIIFKVDTSAYHEEKRAFLSWSLLRYKVVQ